MPIASYYLSPKSLQVSTLQLSDDDWLAYTVRRSPLGLGAAIFVKASLEDRVINHKGALTRLVDVNGDRGLLTAVTALVVAVATVVFMAHEVGLVIVRVAIRTVRV